MARRTAIIGAGPAGCGAALEARRQGDEVTMFEAAEQVGGRTTTWRVDGLAVDSGAGFFTNFYPELHRLLSELDLADEVISLPRSTVLVKDGRRAGLKLDAPGTFFRLPFLSPQDKVRMAAATAWMTVRHRRLDISDPHSLAPLDDRSIADDALARVGESAYEHLVRPSIEPFWYFSPREVSRSLMIALQAKAVDAKFFTLASGMDSVCRAVAGLVETRTGTPVQALRRSGAEIVVECDRGEQVADRVIVATTADVAARISAPLDGLVPAPLRELLADQRYVPNAHASFLIDRAPCPPGVSAMFPCGPGTHPIAAVAFNSLKHQCGTHLPKDRELVSVFLSADESRALVDADDDEIFDRCWSVGRAFCPELPPTAERDHCVARERAIPIHEVGRFKRVAALPAASGSVRFAGDYLATATIDGALRSGRLAAAAG